jgi:hypothetical protein
VSGQKRGVGEVKWRRPALFVVVVVDGVCSNVPPACVSVRECHRMWACVNWYIYICAVLLQWARCKGWPLTGLEEGTIEGGKGGKEGDEGLGGEEMGEWCPPF